VVAIGCEEIDWIVCEAFHDWRLGTTPLAEGAGAIVLEREGPLQIETRAGVPFTRRKEAEQALKSAIDGWTGELIVSSATGNFVDTVEAAVLPKSASYLYPKRHLGEAPGASALWQAITGALAVRRGEAASALVPIVGFNQQVGAVRIALPSFS
jgi:hypothetical protein